MKYGMLNIKSSSVLNSDALSTTSNKPAWRFKCLSQTLNEQLQIKNIGGSDQNVVERLR